MAEVSISRQAKEFMLNRSREYTLYQVQGAGGWCGGYTEPAVSEGKPKSLDNYDLKKFDELTLYVSNSLTKHVTIDLAKFLVWKWLTLNEYWRNLLWSGWLF